MASIRDILKGFFSSGKKPTEAQFHELIDSYYHKTEDGLIMDEEGNFGIGVENPDTRLHIQGGLKIGDAPDEAAQVPQGTLRWTGAELQISFNDTWQAVWKQPAATPTHKTVVTPILLTGKKVSSASIVSAGPFNFNTPATPLKAVKLIRVSFLFDYEKSRSTPPIINPIPGKPPINRLGIKNNRTFSIVLQSSAGMILLNQTTNLPEGTKDNYTLPFEITGIKPIEGVPTFSLQFSIPGNVGTHSVTFKSITITCLCKV